MQYLEMTRDMTLSDLSSIVGERNVDTVLNANSLERSVNIGEAFYSERIDKISTSDQTDNKKKMSILNQFVGDSDLYEKAALGTEQDWNALAQYNCFTDAIRIPIEVQLPPSVGILGNAIPVTDKIYDECMNVLRSNDPDQTIDPTIFAQYNASYTGYSDGTELGSFAASSTGELFQWFRIPWGAVTLHSSMEPNEMIYFPVYPEEYDDGVTANYEEMNEMLYQYEPWKVYKSSGPREQSFTFKFHRDMWTGDHRDGGANDLVRACEANCYPNYEGSLVNVPIVTIYMNGTNHISGVMTSCKTHWYGPIGLDGFYLFCDLTFTIVEVAPEPLNYYAIRGKGILQ